MSSVSPLKANILVGHFSRFQHEAGPENEAVHFSGNQMRDLLIICQSEEHSGKAIQKHAGKFMKNCSISSPLSHKAQS